jgi:hypothetical protein
VEPAFEERLRAVAWADYGTAYGPAVKVPDQLRRLAGPDEGAALAASHDLWCGLCHQHAYVSSAAVPALPFILEVLERAGDQLTVELLDILLGFAVCTRPGSVSAGPWHDPTAVVWAAELRGGVAAVRPRLESLAAHPREEAADFARAVLEELDAAGDAGQDAEPGAAPDPARDSGSGSS